MFKQLFVGDDFVAAARPVTAVELQQTEQISCYPVYFVELAHISTEGAGVRILSKPLRFA